MNLLECAGTITLNKTRTHLLMIQSNKYNGKWSFCGGKLLEEENGFFESYDCGAVRETFEESGIVVCLEESHQPFICNFDTHSELGNCMYYLCFKAIECAGSLISSHEGTPAWILIEDVLKLDLIYPVWTRDCMIHFGFIKE